MTTLTQAAAVAPPMVPDLQMAGDFLRRRGLPVQIVTIDPDLPSSDPGKMAARIFQASEPAQKWIAEQNSQRRNVYFTVNLLRSSAVFNKKPSKADIESLKWLHVDIDPADGETPREAKTRALTNLRAFTPRPSVVIDSGGGIQAFWPLKEPVLVNGNLAELELLNKSLEIALGGDHCWNIDRIMRLPGTVNWPDQKKRAKGRMPALAKLVYFGKETYELGQFPISSEARGQTNGARVHVDLGDDVQLVDDLSTLNPWLQRLVKEGTNDRKSYPSRSEVVCAAIHGLIDSGLNDEVIAGIVLNPAFKISASVLERGHGAVKYAAAEIARARARHEAIAPPVGNNDLVGKPDMSLLNEGRRDPPKLPCDDDGPFLQWAAWIREAAESKSTPPDYIATNLLVVAGSMIGTSRWARAWDGWDEPSVMFAANIGGPSWGKSPAFDSFKAAMDVIEADLSSDYPDKLRAWERDVETAKARKSIWQTEVKEAVKGGLAPPDMTDDAAEPDRPPRPRIVVNDSTPEELGMLLATAPRGLLFQRDELTGWLLNFDRYSGGGERQFWLECFGGRSYTIDRKQHSGNPVIIPHLAVSVVGGVQPDKLSSIFLGGDDDGLTARMLLCWPNRVQPKRPRSITRQQFLTDALRRLRRLSIPGDGSYVAVPLTDDAAQRFQEWRETDYLRVQDRSAGRFAGHVGKMPSFILRQALILEFLWWSVDVGKPEPATISKRAIVGAIGLAQTYYLPMAERCYGDAALPDAERHAAAIGRWIIRTKPDLINARELRREHRADIPGLPNNSDAIKAALNVLVDAGWIIRIEQDRAHSRRDDYHTHPEIKA